MSAILETNLSELKLLGRGKVRDIYEVEGNLLIISTDRISAFDVIMPNGIASKGNFLTELSEFWFNFTSDIVKNHLITTDINKMPIICHQYKNILEGRSMLVKKAKPLPVECVVRGYITGSGWKDYQKTSMISGINIPSGMKESQKFETPLFTPSTKADVGLHDEPISYEKVVELIGDDKASKLKQYSIDLYNKANNYASEHEIILADTKFEFGMYNDEIILIDEVLTPDSSRFWSKKTYEIGRGQDSMDKQVIRDYLETLDWNKQPPAPIIPDEIINKAIEKYQYITKLLLKSSGK